MTASPGAEPTDAFSVFSVPQVSLYVILAGQSKSEIWESTVEISLHDKDRHRKRSL